jgi:hypothetical protein
MGEPRTGIDGCSRSSSGRPRVAPRSPPYARALTELPQVLRGAPGRLPRGGVGAPHVPSGGTGLLLLAALRHAAMLEGEVIRSSPRSPRPRRAPRPSPRPRSPPRSTASGSRRSTHSRVAAADERDLARRRLALARSDHGALERRARGGARRRGRGAGLNLVADVLPPMWTDEQGAPLEVARGSARWRGSGSTLAARRDERGRRGLDRACVWPETARGSCASGRVRGVPAAYTRPAPVLAPIAAPRCPPASTCCPPPIARPRPAYQTVVRDYLAPRAQEPGRGCATGSPPSRRVRRSGGARGHRGGRGLDDGAAIVAHTRVRGGVRDLELARCGFHPTRINRRPAAVAEVAALFVREGAAAQP